MWGALLLHSITTVNHNTLTLQFLPSPSPRFSGPTVHFVDAEYDTGPILAQRVVPVYPTDTPKQLAARVLEQVGALCCSAWLLTSTAHDCP